MKYKNYNRVGQHNQQFKEKERRHKNDMIKKKNNKEY